MDNDENNYGFQNFGGQSINEQDADKPNEKEEYANEKNIFGQNTDEQNTNRDINGTANDNVPDMLQKTEFATPDVPVVKSNGNKKSENDKLKRIIVPICVLCAVAGGIIGGIVSGFIVKKSVTPSLPENPESSGYYSDETTKNSENAVYTTERAVTENGGKDDGAKKNESSTVKSGTYTSSEDKPSLGVTYSAKDIYKKNVDSVVSIEVRNERSASFGTGFIISEAGYIVTNYHVVDTAGSVIVTLYDDRQFNAEIVGYEENNDIAVLKISPDEKIQSLVYGKSSDLSVGDNVYIIGNPLGGLTFTLTTGVVSALNRLVSTGNGLEINMFQTDAAVNSGNSGGPVFDEHGYVVGIASAKYASSSIEGLSFCIPIDDVRSMIDDIINNGYVSGKPLIGISVYDREVVSYGFIQTVRGINGAKIEAVGSGTPAAKAGLQAGDIIVSAGDRSITSVSVLRTVLADYHSGDILVMTVDRNGAKVDVSMVLTEYEPSAPRTSNQYAYDL